MNVQQSVNLFPQLRDFLRKSENDEAIVTDETSFTLPHLEEEEIVCASVDIDTRIIAMVQQCNKMNDSEDDDKMEGSIQVDFNLSLWRLNENCEVAEQLYTETFQDPIQVQFVKQNLSDLAVKSNQGSSSESIPDGSSTDSSPPSPPLPWFARRATLMSHSSRQNILHLLLFRVQQSICYRQIHLFIPAEGEVTLSPNQPDQELLCNVCWCQWDPVLRRLFALTGPHLPHNHASHQQSYCRFEAYQLHCLNGAVTLNLVFRVDLKDLLFSSIDPLGLAWPKLGCAQFSGDHVVGNSHQFRALVVTHLNGCICFCIMPHTLGQTSASSSSSTHRDFLPLHHKIYIFHNERIITCTGSCPSSLDLGPRSRLPDPLPVFMMQNYLVIRQNYFLHFVNVDANSSVRLSVILRSDVCSSLPTEGLVNLSPHFNANVLLLDQKKGVLLTGRVDLAACYRQFCITKSISNGLGLVNMISEVNQSELDILRDLFQFTFDNYSVNTLRQVLLEYLVSTVYQRFSRNVANPRQKFFLQSTTLKERAKETVALQAQADSHTVTISVHSQPFVLHSVEISRQFQPSSVDNAGDVWRKFIQEFAWNQSLGNLKLFQMSYKPKKPQPKWELLEEAAEESMSEQSQQSSTGSVSEQLSKSPPTTSTFFQRARKSIPFGRSAQPPMVMPQPAVIAPSSAASAGKTSYLTRLFNYRPSSRSADGVFGPLPAYLEEEPLFTNADCAHIDWKLRDYFNQKEQQRTLASLANQLQNLSDNYTASVLMQVRSVYHIVSHLLAPHYLKLRHKLTAVMVQPADAELVTFYEALCNVNSLLEEETYPIPASVKRISTGLAYRLLPPPVFLRNYRQGCYQPMEQEVMLCILRTRFAQPQTPLEGHYQLSLETLKECLLNSLSWDKRLALAAEPLIDTGLRMRQLVHYTNEVVFAPSSSSSSGDSAAGGGNNKRSNQQRAFSIANQQVSGEDGNSMKTAVDRRASFNPIPTMGREELNYRSWEDTEMQANPLSTFVGLMQRMEAAKGLPSRKAMLEKCYREMMA